MENLENNKKNWNKPAVSSLSIKKETASGTGTGTEHGGNPKRPAS